MFTQTRRLFAVFLFVLGSHLPCQAATFTVTNTNDSGTGSLRQAILEANSVLPPAPVFIQFNLPTTTGPPFPLPLFPAINLTAPLPVILRTVVIDGTTQPSFNRVAVQGVNAGANADGLHFGPNSDGSLVRGLVINNWSDDGIELEQSDFTFVRGCWIGVDFLLGTLDQGNAHAGVHVNNSVGVRVGGNTAADRNVISGNNANGVWIINDSPGTVVTGNYIGISVDGTTAIPNTNTGVLIVASSNNLVGGPTAAERNIISGNGTGVAIVTTNSVGNRIQGNYIGTDPAGVADLGNLVNGIRVNLAQNTQIGGDASQFGLAPGNVISGNGMAGVLIQSTSATTIQGNIIGGNFDGSGGIPNGDDGIKVEDDPMFPGFVPRRTVIGGRGGLGNSIIANGDSGVWIRDGTGVVIQGNNVLRNFQHGLRIWSDRNLIGGPSSDEGNIIADNQQNGILLQGSAGTLIGGATSGSGTFILGNNGHGILIMEGIAKGLLTGGWNRVEGCNIGRNPHGGASPNSHFGVAIIDSANNIVGGTEEAKGNTIVANVDGGVEIQGDFATGNRVLGNEIGTSALIVIKGGYANGHGVAIYKASNNSVGGSEPGSGNVISGNLVDGIFLQGGASNNRIQGNLIGLAGDGIFGIGNGAAGIEILSSPNNLIGGTEPGARNVISKNDDGIFILGGPESAGNVIQGNFIGTDISGALDRGNNINGVFGQVADLILGGTEPAARNVISGNTDNGVFLSGGSSMDCKVYGNFIGTDATGEAALGNGANGVLLETAFRNQIGGSAPGAGNLISGNDTNGIQLLAFSQHNVIAGNRIGTNAAGNASLGNGENAILIEDAQDNLIGGRQPGSANILSGTNQYGIWIDDSQAKGNHIEGNLIGTDISGTAALGNKFGGVQISDASDNFIGGAAPGAGNLISGNGGSGIRLFQMLKAPGRTVIQGNLIGTDVTGATAVGNVSRGIDFSKAVDCLIGGVTEGARNIISGNGFSGVLFHDEASGNRIQGNYIGTDITGTLPLGNIFDGVILENAPSSLVGGATPGAGNLISGNGTYGIHLLDSDATGNLVQGNVIGTDLSGTADIGNASAGIYIKAATGNIIGGTGEGEGNTIAYSAWGGVVILSGTANPILGNSIHSNAGLGIDLGADGVTLNDVDDTDLGANEGLNFPVITDITATESGTAIEGILNSTPNTEFLIQFFANEICDASGYGEGGNLIGSVTTTTDTQGDATFNADTSLVFTGVRYFTATTTDPKGNTSEFSECFEAAGLVTPTPTPTASRTPSASPTHTPTASASVTATVSQTPTHTQTLSNPPSATPTHTPAAGSTVTATATQSPTPSPTGTCPHSRDLTGNGVINATDLLLLLQDVQSGDPLGDLNCDGKVDGQDLYLFSGGWTRSP